MKKQYIVVAGYGAAVAGMLTYLFTQKTAGLMEGGIFLCVTSMYKITLDKRDGK